MIGKALFTTLFITTSAHAGIETEIAQQQKKEGHLKSTLEAQRELAKQAYQDAFELASSSPLNRNEQLQRSQDAYNIWDEFIEKVCRAEALESTRTRAEPTNQLICMVKIYKEKAQFFRSII